MSTYELAGLKDFTSVLDESGRVYHLRGDYCIQEEDGTKYLPVNRSYAPLYAADTLPNNIDAPYSKDRVLHDEVSEVTALKEKESIRVLGDKSLLFIASSHEQEVITFDPLVSQNAFISGEARRVCEMVMEGLLRRRINYEIGVLGSHQTGLNGPESDLDLIMWCKRDERNEVLSAVSDTFRQLGYTNPNHTKKLLEYSRRIANLGSLSLRAGEHLALRRQRWISPLGVSTSLQCMHEDYDHDATMTAVNNLLRGDFSVAHQSVEVGVEVLPTSDPYNFPRRWDVTDGENKAVVIGFDWAHQGMGNDASGTTESIVRAAAYHNGNGQTLYVLNKPGDYILPADVVQGS